MDRYIDQNMLIYIERSGIELIDNQERAEWDG